MGSNIPILAARIKENPRDSFSKFALALELLKQDHIQKAQLLFENIVDTDPDYVGVYYHLGNLYTEIDENKTALATYKKGIEVAEKINDAHARSELHGALVTLKFDMED